MRASLEDSDGTPEFQAWQSTLFRIPFEQAFGVRASLLSGVTLSGMASLEQLRSAHELSCTAYVHLGRGAWLLSRQALSTQHRKTTPAYFHGLWHFEV